MEDSNQTPLLHQSVNVDISDVVQTDGLSSTVAEDSADDGIRHNLGQFHGQSMNEASEVPIDDLSTTNDDDDDQLVRERSAQPLVPPRPRRSRLYRPFVPARNGNEPCLLIRMEIIICIAFLTVFWSMACIVLVFVLNDVGIMRVGMGCSLLLQPNSFFVESINVEQSVDTKVGPILYGFNKEPPLDIIRTWSDTYYASLPAKYHKDWVYVLNEGSKINISFSVPSSSSLLLTITRGNNHYGQWFYDQTFTDTPLYWNIIHGNGLIHQSIQKSGRYRIDIGSMNSHIEKVQLNMTAIALIYNTSETHYMCMLAQGPCSIPVLFSEENHAVLTTHLKQGISDGEWHVKLTYQPRWSVYFGCMVLISVFMLVPICLFNKLAHVYKRIARWASSRSLLPCTIDHVLSSDSEDVDDNEDEFASRDGESVQHLCVICFKAPRNCFFLPCGHFMACFDCGVRIMSTTGICSICRKRVKKVKNIYTS